MAATRHRGARRSGRAAVAWTVLAIGLGVSLAAGAQPEPDATHRLFYGPRFCTGISAPAEVVAVEVDAEGRIVALHAELPPHRGDLQAVELPGMWAVPGWHDAHLHLESLGRSADRIDLRQADSPEAVAAQVESFSASHPEASVLYGRGWDQSRFPGRSFPSWRDLEGVAGERPIVLTRVDGHAVWVNRAALNLAGIGPAMPDPAGGRIVRDEAGEATGILIDNAVDRLTDRLPEPGRATRLRWLRLGAERAVAAGLVAVHDMGAPPAILDLLRQLDTAGELPLRVFVYLDGADPATAERLGECGRASGRVTVMGIKLFADGAMGSRGAALLADYSDDPGNRGLLLTEPEVLVERIRSAHERGCQVAIHAIGDRGNRVALDSLEQVLGQGPSGGSRPRHRIEHVQLLDRADVPRMARLGVTASMQPTHATSDMRWAEDRLGAGRLDGAYAWRTVLEAGIPLAFGSDAPVEDEHPTLGIYAAVTRQDLSGEPAGGWLPEQRLTVEEALGAFSVGAAYAVGREGDLGELAVGRLFDVTVLDRDPRGAPSDWLEARPTAVVVGGVVELR